MRTRDVCRGIRVGWWLVVVAVGVVCVGTPTAAGQDYCWRPLGSGMNDYVYALTEYNGELIAGGVFTTAGGVTCNYIARWNGSVWQLLGSGMNGPVNALMEYNGELIAGGCFTTAGGVQCNNIARWNGSVWRPLGSGINGCVAELTEYNGELIAGGCFTTAGGVTCNNIARWDGSVWRSLGSGMGGGDYPCVSALTIYNGELIAAGCFTTAGGVTCNYIARWNGSVWKSLGSGMNGCVDALTEYNTELIVGGCFTTAGGVTCNYIARWNGSVWRTLGSGMNGCIYALTEYNAELIAGGCFTSAGGGSANCIARWNGGAWQRLESGVDFCVLALTVYNGELIMGGEFTTAGGVTCNYIARVAPCTGACCEVDGACQVLRPTQCAAACGIYQGNWTACAPGLCPDVVCDPNDVPEGEPPCHDGYLDTYNGGCDLSPYSHWRPIMLDETKCGTTGQFYYPDPNGQVRGDSDWYSFQRPAQAMQLWWSVESELPVEIGIVRLDPNTTCYTAVPIRSAFVPAGELVDPNWWAEAGPGQYLLYVKPTEHFGPLPVCCDWDYRATLSGQGACCHADGSCEVTTKARCDGVFHGTGTICDPNTCVGACCWPDGHCTVISAAACGAGGGNWLGLETSCGPRNLCRQPGACCCRDGHCEMSQVIAPGDCDPNCSNYLGDNTNCGSPNPCPQPGACCDFYTGYCMMSDVIDPGNCAPGYTYMGNNTHCDDPNLCPRGACCLPGDGGCIEVREQYCVDSSGNCGIYRGDGTRCASAACPPTPCHPGDILENEPACYPGYVDTFDSGCDSLDPNHPFKSIAFGTRFCGKSGSYWRQGQQYNDTDWLEFYFPYDDTIGCRVIAQFDVLADLIEPGPWYDKCDYTLLASGAAGPNQVLQLSAPAYPYWFWLRITPQAGANLPCCDWEYEVLVTLTGACCLPNGNCEERTKAACNGDGGNWYGYGVDCRTGGKCPQRCKGDMNCDGRVTFADIDPFVAALSGESAWKRWPCPWINADCNSSGTVTFADIDPFVAVIGTTCLPWP